ncbi:MAG: hypothetical protein ABEH66_00775 [Halobacteriales archaeon]
MTSEGDDTDISADTGDGSGESVLRECYWVVCGQFESSEGPENEIKFSVIAVSIATAVLAFAASTTSVLASTQNWPVAGALFVVGTVVLVFAWFVGLHRFDGILVNS